MADDWTPVGQLGQTAAVDDWTPVGQPAAPTMGAFPAAGVGAVQGATMNFGDELAGLAAASRSLPDALAGPLLAHPVGAGVRGLFGLARRAYEAATAENDPITGQPVRGDATAAYEAARDRWRATVKQAQTEHPVAYTAGQIGGVAASTAVTPLRGAATIGGRAIGGALTGGAIGGLSGVGEGTDATSRAVGGATGLGIGAGAGAVAPYVVEPIVRGARALAAPAVNSVRGAVNPEAEATRRIGLAATGRRADEGLTQAEFAAEQAAGTPVANVDRLGQEGLALARQATNLSPTAHGTLQDLAQGRYQEIGARLSDWMRGQFHFPDAAARLEAIEQTGRRVNTAAYRTAEQEAVRLNPNGVWSDRLQDLATDQVVRDAMAAAQKKLASRSTLEGVGYRPMQAPARVDDAGQLIMRRGPSGAPAYPDLRFWDQTRKELSQKAQVARRAGANDDAAVFGGLAREINAELDNLVPAYGQARAGAAGFFQARDMVEAGQNFVGASARYGLPEVRRTLATATPQERQLFNDGFASRLIEQLDSKAGAARTTMLNRIQQSRAAQEELELGLGGRAQAQAFLARVRVENIMDRLRGAVQGGSNTYRQIIEGGVGTIGGGAALYDPSSWTGAAGIALALRGGSRFVNQRVAQRVAEQLASPDQQIVERGIQMVARSPRLMQALRAADNWTIRALGANAPRVPQMQAGAPGRAEEDQPQVPRPPQ